MLLWIASKWRNCHGLKGEKVDKTYQIYNKEWEVFEFRMYVEGGDGNHDARTLLLSEDWRMYGIS
jgi:hypothetical protein